MILGFEDLFTAIQSDTIALCLEYLENSNVFADKIFVFFYQSSHERMFNAFFKIGDKVKTVGEIAGEYESEEFLDVGDEDLEKLIEACKKYEHSCPNEFKLVYDVNTESFDADYGYEAYSETSDKSPAEVFEEWIIQIKNEV
ncbi:MAG: hypothetical protein UIH27_06275 [Ruminococcus sp.]|nr:hypothetical protein [Ruminococcus sp.]